jgi:glutaminase
MEHHEGSHNIVGKTNVPGSKIKSPIPDYLNLVLREIGSDNPGATASYIPELKDADPERIAIAVSTMDGYVYTAGDAEIEFSIQSISKAFVYAIALEEHGLEYVLKRIGVEPSGEAFNELSLEEGTRRPLNPMINAGAIAAHTLVGAPELTEAERFEKIRKGLSRFAGRELCYDESVFDSEIKTAYRNYAIANMLRNYNIISQVPEDVVKGYTRQCAINVTTRDLALMAATLANGGIQPVTGERVVGRQVVRQVMSVMLTCGMYDEAGEWLANIGFPSKSGVAGGILGCLPGQVGIATWSPRLDSHGNSVRGVRMCKRLSDDMGMHIMDAPEPARAVVRRDYLIHSPQDHGHGAHLAAVMSLQGTINFTSAERITRIMAARSIDTQNVHIDCVILDLRPVFSMNSVARRMVREIVRRLRKTGMRVSLVDPEHILEMYKVGTPGVEDDMVCDDVYDDLSHFDQWARKTVNRDEMKQLDLD